MARSILKAFEPFHAPEGGHHAVSILVPVGFFSAFSFLVFGTAPSLLAAGSGLFYSLCLSFWSIWRANSHQSGFIKFWVYAVITLIIYALLALCDPLPWPEKWGLQGEHIILFLSTLLQGFFTILWQTQLASRARLFLLIEDVEEGRPLWERVREFQLDADFSLQNYYALTSSLLFLDGVLVGLAVWFGPQRGLPATLVVGGLLVFSLWLGSLFRLFRREMEALMYGRRLKNVEKAKALGWTAAMLLIASVGAFFLTTSIAPVIDWNRTVANASEKYTFPLAVPQQAELPNFEGVHHSDNSLFFALLFFEILKFKNLFLVLGFLGQLTILSLPWVALAFLVGPVVRFWRTGAKFNPALLRTWMKLLVNQIIDWIEMLRSLGRKGKSPLKPLPKLRFSGSEVWLESIMGERKGGRTSVSDVLGAFLALMNWAETKWGAPARYRSGETTEEFLRRIAELAPLWGDKLRAISDLVNREFFSWERLTVAERSRFREMVDEVVSTKDSN